MLFFLESLNHLLGLLNGFFVWRITLLVIEDCLRLRCRPNLLTDVQFWVFFDRWNGKIDLQKVCLILFEEACVVLTFAKSLLRPHILELLQLAQLKFETIVSLRLLLPKFPLCRRLLVHTAKSVYSFLWRCFVFLFRIRIWIQIGHLTHIEFLLELKRIRTALQLEYVENEGGEDSKEDRFFIQRQLFQSWNHGHQLLWYFNLIVVIVVASLVIRTKAHFCQKDRLSIKVGVCLESHENFVVHDNVFY